MRRRWKKIIVVGALNFNENAKLLTVRKGKYFLLLGGKIEENETELQALTREVKEETSLLVKEAKKYKTYYYDKAIHENVKLEIRTYLVRATSKPNAASEIEEVI